ncbi:PTS sugar transporter subunit IIA [Jannaschia rubra]|uniref:Nitrogen regulatory protein n=1 Tax=Jannaschia rubra TaxID=282197 RepID=A0A0M6XRG2_9RHOB|nr:PTS sugar transporter subunit IIA [Jannaschia rubra]CTQ32755.1 Nitrogen regulatory protein [Jannaschia rubra]SFF88920.1 PTS IIA-like nitrogen-regulatory protein PtsN [Jannaschia rubra]
MQLGELLDPKAVKVVPKTSSKKRLFCDLAEAARQLYGVNYDEAFSALQDREALGTTGVGGGVALPHARLSGLDRVHGVFMRLETPLDFDATDRKPVDLVFALFAPEGAGVAHLKALALVSRTLRDAGTCAKLRANDDPAVLHTVLTEAQKSEAA